MEIFENETVNSIKILKLFYTRRWFILFAVVFGFVSAFIVTLGITPKFKSVGIVYPSNGEIRNQLPEIPEYGNEMDANRLIQVLKSERVRKEVINKYDLKSYYKIDTTSQNWESQLKIAFQNDILFSRSKYMSVVITANLEDPKLASDIVNAIIEFSNIVQEEIYRENLESEFNSIESSYREKKQLVNSILDTLYSIKDPGIAKNILYNHLLGVENSSGSKLSSTYIDSRELEQLVTNYQFEQKRLLELKDAYEKAKSLYQMPFPDNYIIEKAKPSDQKSSPSLKKNIATGTLAAFLFAILFVVFQERFGELRAEIRKT